jgi:ankyrin repeat protein
MSYELHRCAESGDLERVKELVKGGANLEEVDNDGKTALLLASLHGHFEIVGYLIEQGANVAHTDGDGMTALHWACVGQDLPDGRDLPTVKYLLQYGASATDRDDDGMTALLHAAEWGSLEIIQCLLSPEGGASITEVEDGGKTALLLAADSDCHPSMVQWLLEYEMQRSPK